MIHDTKYDPPKKHFFRCMYSYRMYTVTRPNAKFHCPYGWRRNKLSMERKMFLQYNSAFMLFPSSMLFLATMLLKVFLVLLVLYYCWLASFKKHIAASRSSIGLLSIFRPSPHLSRLQLSGPVLGM
jgi:hypothetical protein